MGVAGKVAAALDAVLDRQRGHLFPWAPVFLGLGIGIYFFLPTEPDGRFYLIPGLIGAAGAVWALLRPGGVAALGVAAALLATGLALASARAHLVAAPVLSFRYYGPVEGRVVALDRSASDALRLTLDRVRLEGAVSTQVPARLRIALHGTASGQGGWPGARIMTTAHLAPPQGPAEPGGFDFRRHAWFQRLGAVGYTRAPVLVAAPPGRDLGLFRLRMAVAARMRAVLPGDIGGFAAAVTTGDRSGVGQKTLEALRASNLAHLLAISGLHMGLLAGFVFAAIRLGLAAIPVLALRLPARKIAAGAAILAAAGYLALSGGNVATERAFVMTAVMLGAVMVDRRAFSLRAVALAALIVLLMRPESLLGPGFQMSFAATTALIAVFGALRDWQLALGPRWLSPVVGVGLSSLVAGLATAPVAAAHFNALAHYGLVANLPTVPVMGLVVIPAAVLAATLAPFGLEALPLEAMGLGLRWILMVANWAAQLPGARGYVTSPGPLVLPLFVLGILFVILWQGWARLVGLIPAAAAVLIWTGAERPAVLIADSGTLVGVMTPQGRALSKSRGAGFVAGIWLENDGDGADQPEAAARWPGGAGRLRVIKAGARRIIHVTGKRALPELSDCTAQDVVVAPLPVPLDGPCLVLDPSYLGKTGAVAFDSDGGVRATRTPDRWRLWSGPVQ
ncbi:ComEC/Rec2 family competence protein [Antarcticimicrobium sediminis]|uniref:ComEC family competence protein n=1 Tax=Antarcticimicrobium sediminis TaxID=2546227 RepID=A0A4R5EZ90_9RHOB|nr:ComEC/Rec2 family competence protein [Antarcticimicrobium sediminis]TDE40381.1 ComEC family competence protein [Antarcticimicrobium sediminis]